MGIILFIIVSVVLVVLVVLLISSVFIFGGTQHVRDEPRFKVGDKIQFLHGCGTIMTIERIENGEYVFKNNMGHVSIREGNKWHLIEGQKSAVWSEEDERKLGESISLIKSNNTGTFYYEKNELADWLKSLKDRVNPKLH